MTEPKEPYGSDAQTPESLFSEHLVSRETVDEALDPKWRRALAAAVGLPRRRVGVINKNNEREEVIPLDDAVAADKPFYVHVRTGMLAVELDGPDAITKAHHLYALLLLDGHLPVLVSSGTEGRRHVLCRVEPDTVRPTLSTAGINRMELRPQTIRPPLSRHRRGGRGALLVPPTPEEVVDRLEGRTRVRALGEGARWHLRQGHAAANSSVSEHVFAVATGAANAGWTIDDFLTVITCHRLPISGLLQQRIERHGWPHTLDWLRNQVWPKAMQRVEQFPAEPQGRRSRLVLHLLRHAMGTPWRGRSGASIWAVYLALVLQHARCGRNPFDASERELCVWAGISSRSTVARALTALRGMGLIERVAVANEDPARRLRNSATWRLIEPPDADADLDEAAFATVLDLLSDDVFRNAVGLGKTAQLMYCSVLCCPGSTAAQVSERTGVSHRQTRTLLGELQRIEMLWRDDEDHWIVTEHIPETDHAAPRATGRAERQVQQFQRERAARDLPSRRTQVGPHPPLGGGV